MMGKKQGSMLLAAALLAGIFAVSAIAGSGSETGTASERPVMKMNITGEIAKAEQGYIIRGKVPAEIFTILNPDPEVLDAFANCGKVVEIEVRIVSGDNVEIQKIDGEQYNPGAL